MQNFLSFFMIQILLLAVVLSVHTYIGLHIIRRNLIFSDLSLDQLAAFGVIVGIGFGIEGGTTASYFVSFIAVVFGSFLLAVVKPKSGKIPREAVIGIIYCMALVASFLVADKISGGSAYITQTLSGCLLWVTWPLVWVTIISYIVLSIFHFKYRHHIIGITERKGIKHENFWDLLFFLSQGIITVLIVPIAGVLLAYAFLMIPAAIGVLFTKNWLPGLIIGWTAGFCASIVGLLFSYFLRLPYGPSLVLALGGFFFIALITRIFVPGEA
ncbi:metal ABC transporter permease [bacterium]|nr:metal ABC transporter permease [bacterium]